MSKSVFTDSINYMDGGKEKTIKVKPAKEVGLVDTGSLIETICASVWNEGNYRPYIWDYAVFAAMVDFLTNMKWPEDAEKAEMKRLHLYEQTDLYQKLKPYYSALRTDITRYACDQLQYMTSSGYMLKEIYHALDQVTVDAIAKNRSQDTVVDLSEVNNGAV